jgi:hypothetical protein
LVLNNVTSKYIGVLVTVDAHFLEANPMKNDFLKEGEQYNQYQKLMRFIEEGIKKYW